MHFQNGNIYIARLLSFAESSNSYHEMHKNQWRCAATFWLSRWSESDIVHNTSWPLPFPNLGSGAPFFGSRLLFAQTAFRPFQNLSFEALVQDLQNILTNQTWESIVSVLRCRSVTTVSQILRLGILSSSTWCCRVILWVLIRAHSSTDSDIRRCQVIIFIIIDLHPPYRLVCSWCRCATEVLSILAFGVLSP